MKTIQLNTIMRFSEWLSLKEIGTGTSSVAVFSRPLLQEPVRRVKKSENRLKDLKDSILQRFSDWINAKRIDELVPTSAQMGSPLQQLPSLQTPLNNQPSQSVNPNNYKGQNKNLYNQVYNKFVQTKDQKLGQTLYKALQGDEKELSQHPQSFKP